MLYTVTFYTSGVRMPLLLLDANERTCVVTVVKRSPTSNGSAGL
jgi:hypothetical protein